MNLLQAIFANAKQRDWRRLGRKRIEMKVVRGIQRHDYTFACMFNADVQLDVTEAVAHIFGVKKISWNERDGSSILLVSCQADTDTDLLDSAIHDALSESAGRAVNIEVRMAY